MHTITSLSQPCYPWQLGRAAALLLREEAASELDKVLEHILFDGGFERFPVLRGQREGRSGLCVHLRWHRGTTWVLPAPSSCHLACASGPALPFSCHCSPCARQLRCSSRLCPQAVALGGSHQGFAASVVEALPLAAGCQRRRGRRPPQMLARLSVLKLERRVAGPPAPVAARARRWSCVLPAAAVLRAGLPAAPGSPCAGRAQPAPWLGCGGGTRHAEALNGMEQRLCSCATDRAAVWGPRGKRTKGCVFWLVICAVLALVVSFMGKTAGKCPMRVIVVSLVVLHKRF